MSNVFDRVSNYGTAIIEPAAQQKLQQRKQQYVLLEAQTASKKHAFDIYSKLPGEAQDKVTRIAGYKPGLDTFEEFARKINSVPQTQQPQAALGSVAPQGGATQPEPKPLVYNDPNNPIQGFGQSTPQFAPTMAPGRNMPGLPLAGFAAQPQQTMQTQPTAVPTQAPSPEPQAVPEPSPLVWNPSTPQEIDRKWEQGFKERQLAQTGELTKLREAGLTKRAEQNGRLRTVLQAGVGLLPEVAAWIQANPDPSVPMPEELMLKQEQSQVARTGEAKIRKIDEDILASKAMRSLNKDVLTEKIRQFNAEQNQENQQFAVTSSIKRAGQANKGRGRGSGAKLDPASRIVGQYQLKTADQLESEADDLARSAAALNSIVDNGGYLDSRTGQKVAVTDSPTLMMYLTQAKGMEQASAEKRAVAARKRNTAATALNVNPAMLSPTAAPGANVTVVVPGQGQPAPTPVPYAPQPVVSAGPYRTAKWNAVSAALARGDRAGAIREAKAAGSSNPEAFVNGVQKKDNERARQGKSASGAQPGEDLVYDDGSARGKKTPAPVGLAAYSAKIKAAYKAKGLPEPSASTIMRGYRLTIPRGKK